VCDQDPETVSRVVREGAHPPTQDTQTVLTSRASRTHSLEDEGDCQRVESQEDNADEGDSDADKIDQGLLSGLLRFE